jgi:hypothetical protein
MPELTDAQLTQLIKDIGLKRPRGSERKPIAHGEFKGARQHRYRGEALCEPCRLAENAYQNERNARGLRKKAAPKPTQYLTEEEWQARVAARRNGGAQ